MATARTAVELARTLRGSAGHPDAPAARPAVARAARAATCRERDALLELIRDEVNVKAVELIGDESELVERRVKPLLPKIGKKHRRRDPGDHGRRPRERGRVPRRTAP